MNFLPKYATIKPEKLSKGELLMKHKNAKIALALVLLVAIFATVGFVYAKSAERTPEYALQKIMTAVKDKDETTLAYYVDTDALAAATYDEGTAILARDIEKLHALYPADWFFRHDTAFMTNYIADRRTDDLALISRTLDFYFHPSETPVTRVDGNAHWLANETRAFENHYTAELAGVEENGNTAIATIDITGDAEGYGQLVPTLTVKAELTKQSDGHYMLTRIANGEDIFYPIVKGIEDYWTLQGWQ